MAAPLKPPDFRILHTSIKLSNGGLSKVNCKESSE